MQRSDKTPRRTEDSDVVKEKKNHNSFTFIINVKIQHI